MEKSMKRQRRMAWGIALAMTAALFSLILLKMELRFGMNDDAFIQRSLMGYETGAPATWHLYVHGLLLWPIHLLYRLWPLMPWYAYGQLALLFLSLTVIAKSLMQCFLRYQKPLWAGAVLAAAFFVAFGLEYVTQFTFTYTAAMLGAAAVAQLFSIDFEHASPRQILWGMLGAAGLVSLCYAIRPDAPLPVLAYCGLAFVFLFWDHRQSRRTMLVSLSLIAAMLFSMVGFRLLETAANGSSAYIEWHNQRSRAQDFYGLGNVPEEVLAEVGWDETTLAMAQSWAFLDEDVSTEAFQTINRSFEEQDEPAVLDRLRAAKRLILNRLDKSAYAFKLMAVGVIAGFAALAGALCFRGRRLRLLFALLGAAGGFGVMLIYLALEGRLPLRAVSVIAVPAIVLIFCLLPSAVPPKKGARTLVCGLTAVILLFAIANIGPVWRLMLDHNGAQQPGQAWADLESYAVQHRDCLFIADGDFAADDVRAFPDYPDGLPLNITSRGGWSMRSAQSEALFERFGLDVWHFDPEAFLREDVFFASPNQEEPHLLLNWLTSKTGKDVAWRVYATHGRVSILQFYENGGNS